MEAAWTILYLQMKRWHFILLLNLITVKLFVPQFSRKISWTECIWLVYWFIMFYRHTVDSGYVWFLFMHPKTQISQKSEFLYQCYNTVSDCNLLQKLTKLFKVTGTLSPFDCLDALFFRENFCRVHCSVSNINSKM